jgi:hypothetical protein
MMINRFELMWSRGNVDSVASAGWYRHWFRTRAFDFSAFMRTLID